MFYENGEPELFKPPVRDFVSNLECVVDLTQKQLDPKITGKLRFNVLFDRETKEEKKEDGAGVIRFE
jgi:hypothetical protein